MIAAHPEIAARLAKLLDEQRNAPASRALAAPATASAGLPKAKAQSVTNPVPAK